MIVIRNRTKGLVVGETQKSFKIRAISRTDSWIPKSQCRIDFDFYEAQLAMHLLAGYGIEDNSINTIAKLSIFIPALILVDRKLNEQLRNSEVGWHSVFAYDVAQEGGAWLAANPKATVEEFTTKLEELIA